MIDRKFSLFRLFAFILSISGLTGRIDGQEVKVTLDEIEIIGSRKYSYGEESHLVKLDSAIGGYRSGIDLAMLLRSGTNINLTEYGGQGSLASIRLRGSGPSHTQINWNGIPLNGPTTGTADLALVSAGMADAAEIVYGASGSIFGSGTFGGAINLWNKPDWNNRLSIAMTGEAGSWNHLGASLGFRAGGKNWQYHIGGKIQSSQNRYPYPNVFKEESPLEYRQHNQLFMVDGQHYFFLRLPKNIYLQYGSWGFDRKKNLPPPIGSTPDLLSDQYDMGSRHYVKITKWFRKSSLELLAGRFSDTLTFNERSSKTDSLVHRSGIRSTRIYTGLSYKWFILSNLTLENAVEADYMTVKAGSYNGPVAELRGAVIGLLRYAGKNLKGTISLRNEFNPLNPPKPLFSINLNYKLRETGVVLKSQFSNKFRLPSLNERYWKPGGNPDLLPESGFGADLGFTWHIKGISQPEGGLAFSVFNQYINNWIQWVPTGSYWSPANVSRVRSRGLEISWNGLNHLGSAKVSTNAMYSFTNCSNLTQTNSGNWRTNQLPYVPFHSLLAGAIVQFRGFGAGLTYRFSSKRFTTDDHDPWLAIKAFHVVDLQAGYTLDFPSAEYRIRISADNLLNYTYQLIRGYPMPGRSFTITLSGIFKKYAHE